MQLPTVAPAVWRWIEYARVRPGRLVFDPADPQAQKALAFGTGSAATHFVYDDTTRGLPRVRGKLAATRVLEFAPGDSVRLEFSAPVTAAAARSSLIGCLGVAECGVVLCALGGTDRWGDVAEYFHLGSWQPLQLTHPGLLDAQWFEHWQLYCRLDDGQRLRLLGTTAAA